MKISFTSPPVSRKIISISALSCVLAGSMLLPGFAALHPGDKLLVTVLNHPELSGPATVDASGNISLPVAGTLAAESLQPSMLASKIEARLSRYVRKVAVSVQLQEQSQSIFVSGGPSGVLHYQPGETLTSVVDQIEIAPLQRQSSELNPHDDLGSAETSQPAFNGLVALFNGPIDFRHVSILRDDKVLGPFDVLALRSSGQSGPRLIPDDTIALVNKPIAVKVAGDVRSPGIAYLDPSDPLSAAIDQVGGTDVTSTETEITLKRGDSSRLVSMGSADLARPAQNGDELVVPRAPRVDVLGTVVRPGAAYLRGNQTLVAAIYYAGGPDRFANLKSVQVMHDGVKTEYNLRNVQKGRDGSNPTLVDGDVVFVPQGNTIDAQTIFSAISALTGVGYLVTR